MNLLSGFACNAVFFFKISILIPGMYFEDIVQRNHFEGILELAPFTYESVIIYSLNIFR
jgi:hypothetical protein